MTLRFEPVSETHCIVYLGEAIDPSLAESIAALAKALRAALPSALVEVVPSYTSLLLEFHPLRISRKQLERAVLEQYALLQSSQASGQTQQHTLTLPVYYHSEVGPDLDDLAASAGLAKEQVVEIHSQQIYTVCAIGFAPGFAFLASVDERIAAPRRATPRLKLPAGSVGIAERQTAVYPQQSPGGWQIIGNCPQLLFDPKHSPMSPFEVGMQVRFEPLSREQFIELGGQICLDWK
ncbi:5-oxoprolinase subunit PxpB [Aliagarivorans marinus]|uniref:5-oxoprolinase subunit PxpB n=1 Tax=Aliagarivorans marinus TaxID=561965 RepID=UPI00041245A4|nr:5-oxoprolinase subunit PxpB [Aliagarivorans marinus]